MVPFAILLISSLIREKEQIGIIHGPMCKIHSKSHGEGASDHTSRNDCSKIYTAYHDRTKYQTTVIPIGGKYITVAYSSATGID